MKKNLKLCLLALLCLPVAFLFAACEASVLNLDIDTGNVKLVYNLGEDFTAEGLVVKAETQDGETAEITDYTIDSSAFNKDQIGTYNIKVLANKGKQTENFIVEVKDKGQLNITKNETFYVGQEFNSNAPVITYTATNGDKKEITDYEVVNFKNDAEGTSSVEIVYDTFTYTLPVEIVSVDEYFDIMLEKVMANADDVDFINTIDVLEGVRETVTFGTDIILYLKTVDDENGTIEEMWIPSTGEIISKISYLTDEPTSYSKETIPDGTDREEILNSVGLSVSSASEFYKDIFTDGEYGVLYMLDEIQNEQHNHFSEILSYSCTNGKFSIEFAIKKQDFGESLHVSEVYLFEIDLKDMFLSKLTDYDFGLVFSKENNIPALPALPNASEKGTLSLASGTKFRQNGQFNFGCPALIYTPIDGSEPYQISDYEVVSYSSVNIGESTAVIKYNTFEFELNVEVISEVEYLKYQIQKIKQNTTPEVFNIYNPANNTRAMIDDFGIFYYQNGTTEYWVTTDGTKVTRENEGSYPTISKEKFDTQILGIKSILANVEGDTCEEIMANLYKQELDALNLDEIIFAEGESLTIQAISSSPTTQTYNYIINGEYRALGIDGEHNIIGNATLRVNDDYYNVIPTIPTVR